MMERHICSKHCGKKCKLYYELSQKFVKLMASKSKDTGCELSIVISYCSIDKGLIEKCIDSVMELGEIIVVFSDCLFDGTSDKEHVTGDRVDSVDWLREKYKPLGVKFVMVPWHRGVESALFRNRPVAFWHCVTRYAGYLESTGKYILSLDADEIMDPAFAGFISEGDYKRWDRIRFQSYWYFREAVFRATAIEPGCSLVSREVALDRDLTFHPMKRAGCFLLGMGRVKTKTGYIGADGPLCHHFSWVRKPDDLYRKVATWAHKGDTDWKTKLDREFAGPFGMKDPVHGYSFDLVPDQYGIGAMSYSAKSIKRLGVEFETYENVGNALLRKIANDVKRVLGPGKKRVIMVPIQKEKEEGEYRGLGAAAELKDFCRVNGIVQIVDL